MSDIYDEMRFENDRQKSKGYDMVHDDAQDLESFCEDVIAYVTWAKQMHRMGSPEKFRRRMMQVGSLAGAACKSCDRKNP